MPQCVVNEMCALQNGKNNFWKKTNNDGIWDPM